jgi:oxygen-dependent protoporphyrinogen oxidase
MSEPDSDVIVVGAGLTGLTAAYWLTRRGLSVTVLEAAPRAGGVIGTRRLPLDDGEALCELGPNSAMDTGAAVGALLRELGLDALRLNARAQAARRYLLRAGRLHAVPSGPLSFVATPLWSWRAKLALLREPFVGRRVDAGEQSVADFARRHLGAELLDYAVEPFVGGIYAGDPQRLSVDAAFPRLAELERRHGSLARGALLAALARRRTARAAAAPSKARATSFNFAGGMQTLIDALARHLAGLACSTRVRALRREPDGRFALEVEGDGAHPCLRARALLLAVPAYEAAPLITPLGAGGPAAAAALAAIDYPPVATVTTVYRRGDVSHPLDGFGFLAPGVERAPVLGTLFASSMFDARAPAGSVVLTSFVGGRRDPQAALAPESQIVAEVAGCNRQLLGAAAPVASAVQRWPRAIPQYDLGHRQRLAAVAALEAEVPGLLLAGNWRDGVALSDCIESGSRCAERIAQQLPVAR